MIHFAALIILAGMVTRYNGPPEYTGPLYCDRGIGLTYDRVDFPWIALDVSEFETHRVKCWDKIEVTFDDGNVYVAHALDAGHLYPHYIDHYGRTPQWQDHIIADIPTKYSPFPGLSATCRLVNLSAAARTLHAQEDDKAP